MTQYPQESPAPTPARKGHPWSLYLGTVAQIPIYLHFTFLLLLAFAGTSGAFGGVFFVIGVFGCIVLHELGHALMARRYGIKTEDIVLYPIGGVARLRSLGQGMQEFWIAIAGPAVNVVIAIAIFIALRVTGKWVSPEMIATAISTSTEAAAVTAQNMPLLQKLMMVNIFLVLFNMIPAFPMDGGRVLRALLSHWMPRPKATGIAARVGQGLAILFILYGLFGPAGVNVMLMFIGLFIFLAAGQENLMVQTADLTTGKLARDAMITRFEVLRHGDSLGRAVDLLLSTSQQDFPVVGGSDVIGVLSAKRLLHALATQGRDHYVAEIMDREFPQVQGGETLGRVLELIRERGGAPVMVYEGPNVVGYINQENLMEYLTVAKIATLARTAGAQT